MSLFLKKLTIDSVIKYYPIISGLLKKIAPLVDEHVGNRHTVDSIVRFEQTILGLEAEIKETDKWLQRTSKKLGFYKSLIWVSCISSLASFAISIYILYKYNS